MDRPRNAFVHRSRSWHASAEQKLVPVPELPTRKESGTNSVRDYDLCWPTLYSASLTLLSSVSTTIFAMIPETQSLRYSSCNTYLISTNSWNHVRKSCLTISITVTSRTRWEDRYSTWLTLSHIDWNIIQEFGLCHFYYLFCQIY